MKNAQSHMLDITQSHKSKNTSRFVFHSIFVLEWKHHVGALEGAESRKIILNIINFRILHCKVYADNKTYLEIENPYKLLKEEGKYL